jgi:hypothetical protein
MFHHLPIIQNPSGDKGIPRQVVDGLINTALNAQQERYVDGLITDSSVGSRKASMAPIRAEGSYVGAPTMPVSANIKAFAPKTKSVVGMMLPVGQN